MMMVMMMMAVTSSADEEYNIAHLQAFYCSAQQQQ